MHKIVVAIITGMMLTVTTTSAMSQQWRGHGFGHNVGPRHGHWHGHRRNHNRNVAPYIAGAIGAAIIGGIIYDQYGRRCYREIVGYDYYGDPITKRICN